MDEWISKRHSIKLLIIRKSEQTMFYGSVNNRTNINNNFDNIKSDSEQCATKIMK